MTNPEDDVAFSKIEEISEVQVESLPAAHHFKDPLASKLNLSARISINRISANKKGLAIAYSQGVALFNMEKLEQGDLELIFDQK
jgi:hypothetical protein